jgi:hypothetical protein
MPRRSTPESAHLRLELDGRAPQKLASPSGGGGEQQPSASGRRIINQSILHSNVAPARGPQKKSNSIPDLVRAVAVRQPGALTDTGKLSANPSRRIGAVIEVGDGSGHQWKDGGGAIG